jgi:hypothetical protein
MKSDAEAIAEKIYREESRYRPALRSASRLFRKECLAVLVGGARQTAALYRGRRHGIVKGKRVPVSAIAAAGALSVFRQYLALRNIPRQETVGGVGVFDDDNGNSVTASERVHVGDGYHAEESKVFQRKNPRGRPPGFGEGSSTPDPAKIWKDAPWSGQHFIARLCKLTPGPGWNVAIPAMRWGEQRKIERRWRLLREDMRGPISLLDPNVVELYNVPGTVLMREVGPFRFQRKVKPA